MSDPIYCGADIDGPKVARHVVAWRKKCRQRVKAQGDHCRFHRLDGPVAWVGTRDPYTTRPQLPED